jgi:glycosyltransferase involved in cell wall biosynthesis
MNNKKIKIVFYSHTVDFAGTWRSHERILENLNKDIFEPYVMYNINADNNRLEYVINILGKDFVLPFETSGGKLGPEYGYPFVETNFNEVLNIISPDIIHFARSGYFEWPFNQRLCPIQIETNIFAGKDESPFLDYSITICDTIKNYRGKSDCTIYNPIPYPKESKENLKNLLGIEDDTFVLGRIGRADNFTSISLDACKILKEKKLNFKYIIISPCNLTKNFVEQNNLTNEVIFVEPTNDDDFIHKFHNTLDIFAHYRIDGECHSTAIAQAMSYGLPIISHHAGWNGQVETIQEGGFVCHNSETYAEKILELFQNKDLYNYVSNKSFERFKSFSYEETIPKFEKVYLDLYNKKNN